MNKFTSRVPLLLLVFVASSAFAIPPLDVTVSGANSGRVSKMITKSDGTFATGSLASGSYVVEFRSHSAALANDQFLLVLRAGKKTVISNAIPGKQFTAGGAAVRMDLKNGTAITGQVASERELSKAKVRMVNGKRLVWVESKTGSNVGGQWVEESALREPNASYLSNDTVREMQERGSQGNMDANEHGPGHR